MDSDYRGELVVILFNFGKEDSVVNMVDKISQINFEKIKAPVIKETDSLGDTGRDNKGYGSTGINEGQSELSQDIKIKLLVSKQNSVEDSNNDAQSEEVVSSNPTRQSIGVATMQNPSIRR